LLTKQSRALRTDGAKDERRYRLQVVHHPEAQLHAALADVHTSQTHTLSPAAAFALELKYVYTSG